MRPCSGRSIMCVAIITALSAGSFALSAESRPAATRQVALIDAVAWQGGDRGWEFAECEADPTIARSRPVLIDDGQALELRFMDDASLAFALFSDTSLLAVVERIETRSRDDFTLFGRLDGGHQGSFTLVIRRGVVAANFRVLDGSTYQIRYLGDGVHVVREIVEPAFPSCGVDDEHEALVAVPARSSVAKADYCYFDDGTVVDVLVVYTPLAREAAGGTAGIEGIIELAAAESNTSYANSLIDTRLSVVHMREIAYDEEGSFSEHLSRLRLPGDGYMDEVHYLRASYRADLVALIVEGTEYCGIAYVMQNLALGYEENAFSVNARTCAAGNLTFAHELGHNMGCAHDRANASVRGLYSYSYGYQDPGAVFRTVMAYNCVGGCPRVRYFSNPDILYQGLPTGVPVGQPDEAHNALTINEAALTIANFRNADCNCNGVHDDNDVAIGTSDDCNENGVPDECEPYDDCNANGVRDTCDITSGTSEDCDLNFIPDECWSDPDCNANGTRDFCDIFTGASDDCNDNDIPDDCESDCNNNNVADSCDLADGTSKDCNANSIPDECDVDDGTSSDCNSNITPDECEFDCNRNEVPDECDLIAGTSEDGNGNGVPDECEAPIIFVDVDATGGDTGLSWTDAYGDLQDALTLAALADGTVEQIWVAAGTYTPTFPGGDSNISFELVNGVEMYGGFAGGELSLDQRNLDANETVLSGRLLPGITFHIVTATLTDETTILDGFTIYGGAASPTLCPAAKGGGMLNVDASPTVRNCVFKNNSAQAGGGMHNNHASHPTVVNCAFTGNSGCSGGGALYNYGNGMFVDCIFYGNRGANGAGMYNYGQPVFVNCLFSGNNAYAYAGGAIIGGRPTLINCTFVDNSADDFGGALYANPDTEIVNCIFWGNRVGSVINEDTQIYVDIGPVHVDYTCLDGWTGLLGGVGNFGNDPLFVDADGEDNIRGTEDDNARLLPGSPCIDAGDNTAVPPTVTTDLDGIMRITDNPDAPDTGNPPSADAIVDMGPYETWQDCNVNGIPDTQDILEGTSRDCNENTIPDECEPVGDCDADGTRDICEIADCPPGEHTCDDCNLNGVPDGCDLDPTDPDGNQEVSLDCDQNTVPDECQPDCDADGTPDGCELPPYGTSEDCNYNDVPDECERDQDCNENTVRDICEIADCPPDDHACDDCNVNSIPDGCDVDPNDPDGNGEVSGDVNGNGIPDECDALVHPGLPADPEHQAPKNRHISLDLSTNGTNAVAYKITLSKMNRCSVDPRRTCDVDADCPNVCAGNHDVQCASDGQCAAHGGTCVPSGPCGPHSDVGSVWYIAEPYTDACSPNSDCVGQFFADVVTGPVYRVWTETAVHVTACEIVPAAAYEFRAVDAISGAVSNPMTQETVGKPTGAHYGDVVGIVSGGVFTPPQGVVNVTDVLAYQIASQGGAPGTAPPHTTWVDLHGVSSEMCPGGACCIPQQILNVGDISTIKFGFIGNMYVVTPGQENPGDCP